MIVSLLGIVTAVILFMINYLSMRLNRIEEDLPKKIKHWSFNMSGKTTHDIACWMAGVLEKDNLPSEQREDFSNLLQEHNKAINDVTIMKVFLFVVLIVILCVI